MSIKAHIFLGILTSFVAVSVEKALSIVYQPQAVFRIRPVNRCSATISGQRVSLHWICPDCNLGCCEILGSFSLLLCVDGCKVNYPGKL